MGLSAIVLSCRANQSHASAQVCSKHQNQGYCSKPKPLERHIEANSARMSPAAKNVQGRFCMRSKRPGQFVRIRDVCKGWHKQVALHTYSICTPQAKAAEQLYILGGPLRCKHSIFCIAYPLTRTFVSSRVGFALVLLQCVLCMGANDTFNLNHVSSFPSTTEQQASITQTFCEVMQRQGMTDLVKAQSRHDARAISICEGAGEGVQRCHTPAATKAD